MLSIEFIFASNTQLNEMWYGAFPFDDFNSKYPAFSTFLFISSFNCSCCFHKKSVAHATVTSPLIRFGRFIATNSTNLIVTYLWHAFNRVHFCIQHTIEWDVIRCISFWWLQFKITLENDYLFGYEGGKREGIAKQCHLFSTRPVFYYWCAWQS